MRDYIMSFDTAEIPKEYTDVVIVGCGIAGLYTALMLPAHMNIIIVAKGTYKETNTFFAQGGISTALGEDSGKKFFVDTMVCGKGESDAKAVWTMVNEANESIVHLERLGVHFDKDDNGQLLLGKEGAHSIPRIIRAGDHTGRSIMEVLYKRVIEQDNIRIIENKFVVDVLTRNNKCVGILTMESTETAAIFSEYTILCTGGIGNLYQNTTNAKGIQGDGLAMFLRANGYVSNMSYIQFHPTVYYDQDATKKQSFLISEALRGEGAILYNEKGERFMDKVHPLKELAPRDIVSMAIIDEIKRQDNPYVYLDITHWSGDRLKKRFPTIFDFLQKNAINMATDYIPVAPKMHYFMGGIQVNRNGQTSINHLYACGECSCTGVHGKNRLASNSLLEAVVFGKRIARHIQKCWIENEKEKEDIRIRAVVPGMKIMEESQTISCWMEQYFSADRTIEQVAVIQQRVNALIEDAKAVDFLTIKEIEKVNAVSVIKEIIHHERLSNSIIQEAKYDFTTKAR